MKQSHIVKPDCTTCQSQVSAGKLNVNAKELGGILEGFSEEATFK